MSLKKITFFVLFRARVAENIRDIMKAALFFQLLICVLFIAFGLFALNQTLIELNFNTYDCMIALLSALFSTFVYCYYADGVTTDLMDICNIFYSSLWYKLPSREQKLLILPIMRSQILFRLNGFGVINCSLEVFASVCYQFWSSFHS